MPTIQSVYLAYIQQTCCILQNTTNPNLYNNKKFEISNTAHETEPYSAHKPFQVKRLTILFLRNQLNMGQIARIKIGNKCKTTTFNIHCSRHVIQWSILDIYGMLLRPFCSEKNKSEINIKKALD